MLEAIKTLRADEAALAQRAASLRQRRDLLAARQHELSDQLTAIKTQQTASADLLADALAADDAEAIAKARKSLASASAGAVEAQTLTGEIQALQVAIAKLEADMVAVEERRRSLFGRERAAVVAFADDMAGPVVAKCRAAASQLGEALAELATLSELAQAANGQPHRFCGVLPPSLDLVPVGLDRTEPLRVLVATQLQAARERLRVILADAGFNAADQ
ncbi:hypothetical protein [Roseateles sp.]|jgi:hypothetical protein|uniref:hypothetical protein n=1 Tax=Roseateles sp. TaxID=1971397 RepID=UPI0037C89CA0